MNLLLRIIAFLRSHGLRSTINRCGEALRRLTYFGRTIIFECTLPLELQKRNTDLFVERILESQFPTSEYERVFGVQYPGFNKYQIAERFNAGSVLWIARLGGELIGFGWTIQGRTLKAHFFPIQSDEVHMYDFFVSPKFRGRGVNIALVHEILVRLGDEQIRRVHLECAAWNTAQLHSLKRTELRRYATASKMTLRGRTIVLWYS